MSSAADNKSNKVRPILDGVVTPKNYIDVVGIPNKEEQIRYITSVGSASTIFFELQNLSCNTFLDRRVRLDFELAFTVSAPVGQVPFTVGDGPKPLNSVQGKMCLKYLPVLANASNIEISINNQKLTYPASRYLEPISRFNGGDASESMRLSDAPVMHDYGRYAPEQNGGLRDSLYDNMRLGSIDWVTRGGLQPVSIEQTGVNAVVIYKWAEYFDLSPLTTWAKAAGFYNISSISVNIVCPGVAEMPAKYLSIDELWTASGGGDLTFSTLGFHQAGIQQRMRLYSITPPFEPKAQLQILPAENINYFPTSVGNVNAGVLKEGQMSSNISLSKVPSKIFIFCNRANENILLQQANTYGLITKITMNYGNRSNYFQDFDQYDIYSKFVYNKGFKVPYNIYQLYTGSVLCIEPQDIVDSLPAGSSCCTNLQFTVTFRNLYGANTDFQLMVVIVNDAVISYSRTTFQINDIIIDPSIVMEKAAMEYHAVPENVLLPACKLGSGFKDEFMSALSTVLGSVQAAARYYNQNKEWINPILETAKDLGLAAAEIIPSLFASGLHPDEMYERLSRVYPQPELNKVFKSLKSAGCCSCDYLDLGVSMAGGKAKAKSKGKKAGVIIQDDDDFDEPREEKVLRRIPLSKRY